MNKKKAKIVVIGNTLNIQEMQPAANLLSYSPTQKRTINLPATIIW